MPEGAALSWSFSAVVVRRRMALTSDVMSVVSRYRPTAVSASRSLPGVPAKVSSTSMRTFAARHHLIRSADFGSGSSPYYSDIGRPSARSGLMIRMLIVGTATALGTRRLCEEVTASWLPLVLQARSHRQVAASLYILINRLERFVTTTCCAHVFERVVAASWRKDLVEGGGCGRCSVMKPMQPLSRQGA